MNDPKKDEAVPGQGLTAGVILTSALDPHGAFQLVLIDKADFIHNSIFLVVSNQTGTNLGGETVRDRVTMTGEEIEALYREYQKQEPKETYLEEPERLRWCENCQRVLEDVVWPYTGDAFETWNPETRKYEHGKDGGYELGPGGECCPDCHGEAVFAEPEVIEAWEAEKKRKLSAVLKQGEDEPWDMGTPEEKG